MWGEKWFGLIIVVRKTDLCSIFTLDTITMSKKCTMFCQLFYLFPHNCSDPVVAYSTSSNPNNTQGRDWMGQSVVLNLESV